MTICLAKMPVFDYTMTQIAYQLPWIGKNQAETDMGKSLVKSLKNIHLDQFLVNTQGYIQIPKHLLNSHYLSQLPDELLTLCVESNLLHDPQVRNEIERLKSHNFQIAINHVYENDDIMPFIGLANCVILDAGQLNIEQLKAFHHLAEPYALPVLLEKIHHVELFEQFRTMFNAFSGDFYLKPVFTENTGKAPPNRMVLVKLMSRLQQEEVDTKVISDLIGQDARLGYHLLKIINSSMFNLPRDIESLHEAVVLLGIKQIRDWANMILISNLKDKPNLVLKTTMFRAKMAELLAEIYHPEKAETYFTIGLFSTIDVMLNKKMKEVIEHLPFAGEIKKALISQEGEYSSIFNALLQFEQGNFAYFENSALDIEQVMTCYLDANLWTNYTSKLLFGTT